MKKALFVALSVLVVGSQFGCDAWGVISTILEVFGVLHVT